MAIFVEDGREVSTPLEWFPKLRNASPAELNDWRFIGDGEGIHWESLDEDLLVSELISRTFRQSFILSEALRFGFLFLFSNSSPDKISSELSRKSIFPLLPYLLFDYIINIKMLK